MFGGLWNKGKVKGSFIVLYLAKGCSTDFTPWSLCLAAYSRVQPQTVLITTDKVPIYTPGWRGAQFVLTPGPRMLSSNVVNDGIEPTILGLKARHLTTVPQRQQLTAIEQSNFRQPETAACTQKILDDNWSFNIPRLEEEFWMFSFLQFLCCLGHFLYSE